MCPQDNNARNFNPFHSSFLGRFSSLIDTTFEEKRILPSFWTVLATEQLWFEQTNREAASFRCADIPSCDQVASPQGGMDIEAVAAATPELIFKEPFNLKTGPSDEALERLAVAMGFDLPDTVKV
jgi:hypothetical protein